MRNSCATTHDWQFTLYSGFPVLYPKLPLPWLAASKSIERLRLMPNAASISVKFALWLSVYCRKSKRLRMLLIWRSVLASWRALAAASICSLVRGYVTASAVPPLWAFAASSRFHPSKSPTASLLSRTKKGSLPRSLALSSFFLFPLSQSLNFSGRAVMRLGLL